MLVAQLLLLALLQACAVLAQSLVQNGGFDGSLDGWTANFYYNDPSLPTWLYDSNRDVNGATSSGSAGTGAVFPDIATLSQSIAATTNACVVRPAFRSSRSLSETN